MVEEPLVGAICRLVTGVGGMVAKDPVAILGVVSAGVWRLVAASLSPVTSDGRLFVCPMTRTTTRTGIEGGLGALQEANRF
jgi:hypothetical protein